jgi:AcrR family transcriptional regulator
MTEESFSPGELPHVDRQARRNLLIDSATSLFAHKPFSRVSMREIAREAKISPASIYRYFEDRDELFVELLAREREALENDLTSLLESSPPDPVSAVAHRFVEYLLHRPSLFEMMTYFMMDTSIGRDWVQRFNEERDKLLAVFDGLFSGAGDPREVRLVSRTFFAVLSGILVTGHHHRVRDRTETLEHLRELTARVVPAFQLWTA